jgi:hypothetical protein
MSLLATLRAKKQFREFATATPATVATDTGQQVPSVARVATVAVASLPSQQIEASEAANDTTPATDPDRWCWPHSEAMNGREIDTFTARLARFTDKGLTLADAEQQADRLVIRDREGDDRRLCLECAHLHGAGRWRCGNWHRAEVATQLKDAHLPGVLVQTLQRCPGFGASTP